MFHTNRVFLSGYRQNLCKNQPQHRRRNTYLGHRRFRALQEQTGREPDPSGATLKEGGVTASL
jgi:hypothetical protein